MNPTNMVSGLKSVALGLESYSWIAWVVLSVITLAFGAKKGLEWLFGRPPSATNNTSAGHPASTTQATCDSHGTPWKSIALYAFVFAVTGLLIIALELLALDYLKQEWNPLYLYWYGSSNPHRRMVVLIIGWTLALGSAAFLANKVTHKKEAGGTHATTTSHSGGHGHGHGGGSSVGISIAFIAGSIGFLLWLGGDRKPFITFNEVALVQQSSGVIVPYWEHEQVEIDVKTGERKWGARVETREMRFVTPYRDQTTAWSFEVPYRHHNLSFGTVETRWTPYLWNPAVGSALKGTWEQPDATPENRLGFWDGAWADPNLFEGRGQNSKGTRAWAFKLRRRNP